MPDAHTALRSPGLPGLPHGAAFHHVGYATRSLEREAGLFAAMGYMPEAEPFADPVQGVMGIFLAGPGPRLELLENLPGSDTLTPWLERGVRMYHLAYTVPHMPAALQWAAAQGGKTTVPPVPAAAFGGRCIAFVMFRAGLLIEFIEQPA